MESNEALWKFKMKRDFTAQRGLWGVFFFFLSGLVQAWMYQWSGVGRAAQLSRMTKQKKKKANSRKSLLSLVINCSSESVLHCTFSVARDQIVTFHTKKRTCLFCLVTYRS